MDMNMNQNQTLKYLALGILVGYLTPYLLALIKKPLSASEKLSQKENKEELSSHQKSWNLNT